MVTHIVLGYVPTMIELTGEQRRGMPAAVGAWVDWAAFQQGLDDVAREHLATALPAILDQFDAAYDEPDNVQHRAYLRDRPATAVDAQDLAAIAGQPTPLIGGQVGSGRSGPARRRPLACSVRCHCWPWVDGGMIA